MWLLWYKLWNEYMFIDKVSLKNENIWERNVGIGMEVCVFVWLCVYVCLCVDVVGGERGGFRVEM